MPDRLPPPLESVILKQCLQYLTGVRGWLAWRNNSGAMSGTHNGKRRFVRFNSAVGSSDIFAVAPDGRFWSIEVKRPGKNATDQQNEWLDRVRAAGGVACVVRSVEELREAMRTEGYG